MTQDPLVNALLTLTASGSTWVLWLLIGLSLWATALIVERWLAQRALLRGIDAAVATVRSDVALGLNAEWRAPDAPGLDGLFAVLAAAAEPVAAADARIDAVAGDLRRTLLKRTAILGTLGANTPFIGLLGTVLGIIQAFRDLALAERGGAAEAVIAGIAEALVATGMGLAVAIPCVVAYNVFVNRGNRAVARLVETARWLAAVRRGG